MMQRLDVARQEPREQLAALRLEDVVDRRCAVVGRLASATGSSGSTVGTCEIAERNWL